MSIVLYFLVALVLSFAGSLPTGLITLTITQRTLEHGREAGMKTAGGATVWEFVYPLIALVGLDWISESAEIDRYIKVVATLIFFGMGIYYFTKKQGNGQAGAGSNRYFDFVCGLAVGGMNMLIIPFWVFFGLWLRSNGMPFDALPLIIAFSLGAALGAFLAFVLYILLSEYINGKIDLINCFADKAVANLFLILGVYQVMQFF